MYSYYGNTIHLELHVNACCVIVRFVEFLHVGS